MFYLILCTTLLDWFLRKTAEKEMPVNSPGNYKAEDVDRCFKEFVELNPHIKVSREQIIKLLDIIRENGGENPRSLEMANQFVREIMHENMQQQHLSNIVTASNEIAQSHLTHFPVLSVICAILFFVIFSYILSLLNTYVKRRK